MGGFLERFGTAFGAGALGAAVAAIPAGIRMGAGSGSQTPTCSPYCAWVVLATGGLAPMLISIFLLRAARVGLKAFGGPGRGTRFAGVILWGWLELLTLVAVGALLRARTHHHALAGVTFALGSLAVSGGLALVTTRFARIVSALPDGQRRPALVAGLLAIAVLGALVLRRSGLDGSDGLGRAGATIIDLLAFCIVATFASRPDLSSRRLLALVALPATAALVFVGASSLQACPQVIDAARGAAPLYSQVLTLWPSH
jgi:hypothetical protein